MKEICKKELCSGCHACYNVCPKSCISMDEDDEGFLFPKINSEKCSDCGLCKKTCPVLHNPKFNDSIKTYASWSRDINEQKTSTSGGIASTISRQVIKRGGVVFGAGYNADLSVSHKMANDDVGVDAFKGSKYVQSRIDYTFREIKEKLTQGKEVLFIGTPCQVGGLNNFTGDFNENLTTVDLVCHGVPSYKILKAYITKLENQYQFKADKVSFRDENGCSFSLFENGRMHYSKQLLFDEFYIGFLKALFQRTSCNKCIYAKPARCSDITIGDFWGLGREVPFEHHTDNGISLCMVNTKKGEAFIQASNDVLNLFERQTNEAVLGNNQLQFPSVKHKNREKFFTLMNKKGIKIALSKTLWKEKLAYKMIYFINKSKRRLIGKK